MGNAMTCSSLVVDFGGSATKVLLYERSALSGRHSFPSDLYACSVVGIKSLIEALAIDSGKLECVVATGGKSADLPDTLFDKPLLAIDEIQAVGAGGLLSSTQQHCLVVSIGTGTAMAVAKNTSDGLDVRHVGGLGLGGGTIIGLGRLLCGAQTFDELNTLAIEGSTEHVDLLVGDIVGRGIGVVPAAVTASNFGKAASQVDSFSKADIAAGLMTMVGQSIARLAIVLSRQSEVEETVVIGQVSENVYMQEVFANMQALFGGQFVFATQGRYRVAQGAFHVAADLNRKRSPVPG
jgi:type II pantothenate kinase